MQSASVVCNRCLMAPSGFSLTPSPAFRPVSVPIGHQMVHRVCTCFLRVPLSLGILAQSFHWPVAGPMRSLGTH
eukprot:706034-Pyramimonas_sp.AAC.1